MPEILAQYNFPRSEPCRKKTRMLRRLKRKFSITAKIGMAQPKTHKVPIIPSYLTRDSQRIALERVNGFLSPFFRIWDRSIKIAGLDVIVLAAQVFAREC